MREKLTDLELEAVHLRGRVAELERICAAQRGELGNLRGHDGGLTGREWRILDMWPRFEDNEPVWFGDVVDCIVKDVGSITISESTFELRTNEGFSSQYKQGHRVKRPVPEVLDADGVPIKVGDILFDVKYGTCREPVASIEPNGHGRLPNNHMPCSEPCVVYESGGWDKAEHLTHRKPDSWERLFNEAAKCTCDYFGRADGDCIGCPAEYKASCEHAQMDSIVCRAKKLAGVAE